MDTLEGKRGDEGFGRLNRAVGAIWFGMILRCLHKGWRGGRWDENRERRRWRGSHGGDRRGRWRGRTEAPIER